MDSAKPKVAYSADEAAESQGIANPTRDQAIGALRTVLSWIGEDPAREGLIDTPDRVLRAYKELFSGYSEDPAELLQRTFEEVPGYQDMVLVKGIEVSSYCEHHMMPILGVAHVAYVPNGRVVGISKLARVVQIFSRRLQSQEQFTVQIAEAVDQGLQPGGVAVQIEAQHFCMKTRGIQMKDTATVTTHLTGKFLADERLERRFFRMVQEGREG